MSNAYDITYSFLFEDVLLSVFLAVVGAYASMECCTIARRKTSDTGQIRWLAAAAFCFGYSTVFTMHYVGMTAVELELPSGERLAAEFSLPLILLSIPSAVLGTFFGLYRLRHVQPHTLRENKVNLVISGLITAVGVGVMHVSEPMLLLTCQLCFYNHCGVCSTLA